MRIYKIKKGNHYCSMSIFEKIGAIGWNVTRYKVRFILNPSCWWTPARNIDDHDLNKLTGIGFGLNHQNNSVRFTWVPDFAVNGKIDLWGYTYDEKKTAPKFAMLPITSVQAGQPCDAMIEVLGNKYALTVNGVTVQMDNLHPDPNLCFRLYPFFGGNNTAPQDMTIEIDYL